MGGEHRIVGGEEIKELAKMFEGSFLWISQSKNNDKRGIGERNSPQGMRRLVLGVYECLQQGDDK